MTSISSLDLSINDDYAEYKATQPHPIWNFFKEQFSQHQISTGLSWMRPIIDVIVAIFIYFRARATLKAVFEKRKLDLYEKACERLSQYSLKDQWNDYDVMNSRQMQTDVKAGKSLTTNGYWDKFIGEDFSFRNTLGYFKTVHEREEFYAKVYRKVFKKDCYPQLVSSFKHIQLSPLTRPAENKELLITGILPERFKSANRQLIDQTSLDELKKYNFPVEVIFDHDQRTEFDFTRNARGINMTSYNTRNLFDELSRVSASTLDGNFDENRFMTLQKCATQCLKITRDINLRLGKNEQVRLLKAKLMIDKFGLIQLRLYLYRANFGKQGFTFNMYLKQDSKGKYVLKQRWLD